MYPTINFYSKSAASNFCPSPHCLSGLFSLSLSPLLVSFFFCLCCAICFTRPSLSFFLLIYPIFYHNMLLSLDREVTNTVYSSVKCSPVSNYTLYGETNIMRCSISAPVLRTSVSCTAALVDCRK